MTKRCPLSSPRTQRGKIAQMQERTVGGLHEALVPHIAGFSRSTPILDLGCGTGAWLDRLRSLGFTNLCGVDADPPQGCIRANLDVDEISLTTRFGLITAIEVIEHLETPGRLLDIASSLLAPEGRLLVTTPNIHSLRWRVRFLLSGEPASFDEKGDPTHISPILLQAFQKCAARRGLVVERKWAYPDRGTKIYGRTASGFAPVARAAAAGPRPGDN